MSNKTTKLEYGLDEQSLRVFKPFSVSKIISKLEITKDSQLYDYKLNIHRNSKIISCQAAQRNLHIQSLEH